MRRPLTLLLALALTSTLAVIPASARDSLGIFSNWGAFRDPEIPRCYAIAQPIGAQADGAQAPTTYQPYAAIGTWPRRSIHGALHLRLSHRLAPGGSITLSFSGGSAGGRRFPLVGGGGDAWPQDARADAAIAAALRSASQMSVTARDTSGRYFTDSYPLAGAATAIDAAAIGCAGLK